MTGHRRLGDERSAALLRVQQSLFAQYIDGLADRDTRDLNSRSSSTSVDIFWPGSQCFVSIRRRITEATWMYSGTRLRS